MRHKPLYFKHINLIGFWTFYWKEVKRFLSIPSQAFLAPIVTNILFLFVFQLSIGRVNVMVGELTFIEFLVPGLIMMQIMQNSYGFISSALISGKMQGAINDVLMPPVTNMEILTGYIMSGVTRGVLVGISGAFAMSFFVDIKIYSYIHAIYFTLLGAMFMSCIGFISGLWASRWDDVFAITSYFVTPLAFLSGTFYSADQLPEKVQFIVWYNPFFYIIDGFRYSLTGYAETNINTGMIIIFIISFVFFIILKKLLDIGWKIKS